MHLCYKKHVYVTFTIDVRKGDLYPKESNVSLASYSFVYLSLHFNLLCVQLVLYN